MNDSLLELDGVTVRFGGITALDRVALNVRRGSITGLIGPNGAGKTTLFNVLSGLVQAQEGSIISLAGRPLPVQTPHAVAAAGIGRTFQNLALLPTRSVRENMLLGAHGRIDGGFLAQIFGTGTALRGEMEARRDCEVLLNRLGLAEVADVAAGGLPFGTRKRIELGRALMIRPQLLLLDEPACGLNPAEIAELRILIMQLRTDYRLTVLLIEHHMPLVMRTCDSVVVMNFGTVIACGTPSEVAADPAVLAAYLGSEAQHAVAA